MTINRKTIAIICLIASIITFFVVDFSTFAKIFVVIILIYWSLPGILKLIEYFRKKTS